MLEAIPSELKQYHNWVVWRYEDRGGGKLTKPPYTISGYRAYVNNPATWTSYDEAVNAYQHNKFAGIGFMLTHTPYVGIDIDDCVNLETGSITPEATEALGIARTYSEISVSGTGLHIILKGKLPDGRRRVGKWEMYGDGSPRYLTVSSLWVNNYPNIRASQSAIDAIFDKHFRSAALFNSQERRVRPPRLDGSDEELLWRARNARNGSLFVRLWEGCTSDYSNDDSRADMALVNILAFYCGRDLARIDRLFRQSGLMRLKWDERHGQDTYGNITIKKAIERCIK